MEVPKIEVVEEKITKYKVTCPKCGKEIFGRSPNDAIALLNRHKWMKGCGE